MWTLTGTYWHICNTVYEHTDTLTLPADPWGHASAGRDVYADLAWQQHILLYTPSSYCLCLDRHGSLTHRSTAWRQIDCEHPDCPSRRGVWQSTDSHAELISQACCLFSPALPSPAALLSWVSTLARLPEIRGARTRQPPPSKAIHPFPVALNNWQWQNNKSAR